MKKQVLVFISLIALGVGIYLYREHKEEQDRKERLAKIKAETHKVFEEMRQEIEQTKEESHKKVREYQIIMYNRYIREGGPRTAYWKEELDKVNLEEQRYLHGK